MRAGRLALLVALGALAQALASAAAAREDTWTHPPADELLHSDLPLWTSGDDVWPRGFVEADAFGCTSRVAFGDWIFTPVPGPEDEGVMAEREWWRFANYGVFHCAMVENRATERSELGNGAYRHAWFVRIGTVRIRGAMHELWDLQSGSRPGSEHMLLMRPTGDGAIRRFTVLQRTCSAADRRKGPGVDIWRTDYCAVNARKRLVDLARRMAMRPPLGTLAWQAPIAGDVTPRPGPAACPSGSGCASPRP